MRISDWSSDVCSSDLLSAGLSDETARRRTKWWCDLVAAIGEATAENLAESRRQCELWIKLNGDADLVSRGATLTCLCFIAASRSEERRVGKEWFRRCISRWWP